MSTDLRDGEGRQGHLASSQRLRLLVRCVVCIQLCRSAASLWQLLRDLAVKPAPDRSPLWRQLHSAAARQEASLRSVPRQPNPQGKEQHQENSRSSLISSFSPFRSLIKGTRLVSEMLARRVVALGDHSLVIGKIVESYITDQCFTGGTPDIRKVNPLS